MAGWFRDFSWEEGNHKGRERAVDSLFELKTDVKGLSVQLAEVTRLLTTLTAESGETKRNLAHTTEGLETLKVAHYATADEVRSIRSTSKGALAVICAIIGVLGMLVNSALSAEHAASLNTTQTIERLSADVAELKGGRRR
jgi:hypothetical protein